MANQRVILIGDGAVGSSFAYSSIIQGVGREFGIIDINKKRVEGDVLDLSDALAYREPVKIFAAEYSDCKDADVVVITAGLPQKEGETRLDLVDKNLPILKDMVDSVVASGFNGVFLVASNPVDIMTYATWKFSGFPAQKIVGSGTSLDSARFRHEIASLLDVDTRSVHAYIMGEHGDSEFPVWSKANIGGLNIYEWVKANSEVDYKDLEQRFIGVRDKAYAIIERKGATHYGIGVALTRIVKAILNDENTVLPLSIYLNGEYDIHDVFIGAPAIIGRNGVRNVIDFDLNDTEAAQMQASAKTLKETIESAFDKLDMEA
ncbi:L-lactate dehydrogenase [Suicoccus acidiformans]|uniref:L-lactate dehydrogenase n=1 Tax=Suicoccus acidiformans TaxID=2036206 RepID=UPI001F0941C1|nr:L-lactate dehydrogenase [Suicoccus acidiformans]